MEVDFSVGRTSKSWYFTWQNWVDYSGNVLFEHIVIASVICETITASWGIYQITKITVLILHLDKHTNIYLDRAEKKG